MNHDARCPTDFKLNFGGTLQLLTSGWERVLGYAREEFKDKTLVHRGAAPPLPWRQSSTG
jgi:hypothetical protein